MARKCSTRYRRGSKSGWWRDKPHFHTASDILAISALYSCEEETRSEKMRLSGSASILSEETHPFLRPRDHHQGWEQPALTEEATKGDLQIQQPNAHHNVAWQVTTVNWAMSAHPDKPPISCANFLSCCLAAKIELTPVSCEVDTHHQYNKAPCSHKAWWPSEKGAER